MLFPNLNAEQARYGDSNEKVAEYIGITRVSYESKKRRGNFSIAEANALCERYKCDYRYLFSETPTSPNT